MSASPAATPRRPPGLAFGGPGRRCPHCRGALLDCGTKFKAPRRIDAKRWRLLEQLYDRTRASHTVPAAAERNPEADWDARFEQLSRLRCSTALARRMISGGLAG